MKSRTSEASETCKSDEFERDFSQAKIEAKESLNLSSVGPQPGGYMTPAASLEDLDEEDDNDLKLPELSHFSEEGIADMDIPDDILDELEYLDNITSCDKVENYLMLSEYEQNLIKEKEGPASFGRRARKWSLVRQASSLFQGKNILVIKVFLYILLCSRWRRRWWCCWETGEGGIDAGTICWTKKRFVNITQWLEDGGQ